MDVFFAFPAILLALTAGTQPALAALLLYLIIQQVENNVLQPFIFKRTVNVHPLAVILAMSGVAHALKDAVKPGEPSWYPWALAAVGAFGALVGGLLERRRAAVVPGG